MFLKFSQKFRLSPATLLNKRLSHRCFPVNFLKFLKTSFFTEHLGTTTPQITDSLIRVGIMLILETENFLLLSPNQCATLWRWCKLTFFFSLNLLFSQVWKKYIGGNYVYSLLSVRNPVQTLWFKNNVLASFGQIKHCYQELL